VDFLLEVPGMLTPFPEDVHASKRDKAKGGRSQVELDLSFDL
jgi:hypothetical protein